MENNLEDKDKIIRSWLHGDGYPYMIFLSFIGFMILNASLHFEQLWVKICIISSILFILDCLLSIALIYSIVFYIDRTVITYPTRKFLPKSIRNRFPYKKVIFYRDIKKISIVGGGKVELTLQIDYIDKFMPKAFSISAPWRKKGGSFDFLIKAWRKMGIEVNVPYEISD